MIYFTTLFDKHYLIRGLSLYESLIKIGIDFHLYIFAFCDESLRVLKELNLEKTTVISLQDFEDSELLKIKGGRTIAEYCWTCTPSVIKYVIEKFNIPYCIYLDADIYFFSSPESVISELTSNYSIGITPHRFSNKYKNKEENGIYNVQFMYFKNDINGIKALKWWRERCNEWCYARLEDGKFGDQKYLDDWPTRFQKVKVIEQENIGVAPWNFQNYQYSYEKNEVYQKSKIDGSQSIVIFYHFHNLKIYRNGYIYVFGYNCTKDLILTLYELYKEELVYVIEKYKKYFDIIKYGLIEKDLDSYILFNLYNNMKKNIYASSTLIIYNKELFNKVLKKINIFNILISIFKKIVKKVKEIIKSLWKNYFFKR